MINTCTLFYVIVIRTVVISEKSGTVVEQYMEAPE